MTLAISIADILTTANQYLDQAQYSAAHTLYTLIQAHTPEQADCLHGMGVLALKTNHPDVALQLLARAYKAIQRLPHHTELVGNKALFLAHLGQAYAKNQKLAWALMCWSRSLDFIPNPTVQVWFDQGLAQAKAQGEMALAALPTMTKRADAGRKISTQLKNLLDKKKQKGLPARAATLADVSDEALATQIEGLINQSTRDAAAQAETLAIEMLRRYPEHGDAWHWRGIACFYQKRGEEGLPHLLKAVALYPNHPYYYNTLGVVQRQYASITDAEKSFEQALTFKPDYAEAGMNFANLLRDEGEYDAAIGWYIWAQRLKANYFEALNNLGILFKNQKAYESAKFWLNKTLEANPNYPNAYLNLGVIAEEERKRPEAIEFYEKTIFLKPDLHEVRLSLAHQKMHLCDWSGLEAQINTVRQLVRERYRGEMLPFNFLSLPGSTALEQKQCGELFFDSRYSSFARKTAGLGFVFRRERKARIRIGFLSVDFREHAVAISLVQVIEKFDRSRFELIAYAYGPDHAGPTRQRLKASFDQFIDIEALSHIESAQKIYQDQIDILVDLTGYTAGSRSEIMALHPAPVQVSYLGYSTTMGTQCVEYLIGDPIITPLDHAAFYAEKLALLPDCYFPHDRNRLLEGEPTREGEGLPADQFVFCSFNQPYKVNPQLWDVWCRILREVPNSVLWLHGFEQVARDNLGKEAEARGVSAARLIFAKVKPKLSEHLARIALADLALDTIPYGGHTTTGDALWAGTPVLTCLGESFAARVAASMLDAVGLPQLITHDFSEYANLAIRLAQDSVLLDNIKKTLKENRLTHPLFDSQRLTKNLEKVFEVIYKKWIEGEEPAAFQIQGE